jgi:hypothetical protein
MNFSFFLLSLFLCSKEEDYARVMGMGCSVQSSYLLPVCKPMMMRPNYEGKKAQFFKRRFILENNRRFGVALSA